MDLEQSIETIEAGYEFLLAYAAQGRPAGAETGPSTARSGATVKPEAPGRRRAKHGPATLPELESPGQSRQES